VIDRHHHLLFVTPPQCVRPVGGGCRIIGGYRRPGGEGTLGRDGSGRLVVVPKKITDIDTLPRGATPRGTFLWRHRGWTGD